MTGVLITFNFASLAFLLWAFCSGYWTETVRTHILISLGATAFSVFSHCMSMMYVTAIGRMIRQTVEKGGLDSGYVHQTKSYRSKIFKVATPAMLIVMLQTILGGGAHTKAFPLWIHTLLGVLAFLVNCFAVYYEIRFLIANHLLGHRVAREYEKVFPQST